MVTVERESEMDPTARFYSQPSYVGGGAGFPIFSGSRRQRGGGIFGSLAKMVLPVLKNVGSSILRTAGKEAIGLAHDVAESALSGEGMRGVKRTLRQQGLKRLRTVGQNALRTAMSSPSRAAPGSDGFLSSATSATALGKRRHRSSTTAARRGRKRQRRGGGSSGASANF